MQHYGGMRMHAGSQMGLHTSLVNEAPFDENDGLLGFYGNTFLSVSGNFSPVVFDSEIAHDLGVELVTPLQVRNNLNFIIGDFRTDRSQVDQYLALLSDAFTVGETDLSKVDGFVLATEQSRTLFPVGDAAQLRPLIFQASGNVPVARCAYFRENPANSSLYGFLDPLLKPRTLEFIGGLEFWRLESSVPGTITVSWNVESNLGAIATELGQIELVGWNKSAGRWLPLGTSTRSGDVTEGFAVSEVFTPDDYEVITFGGLGVPEDVSDLDNFYVSPNGDGINDFLYIEELEESPNNQLRIYDRRGLLVFAMDNYTNEFNGISNVEGLVIDREAGLPEGVYFYLLRMDDLGLEYQGFLYLQR